MKITVLGATGGTGGEVVRQALAAGHEVTAVVRDPSRLGMADRSGLEVVTADVTDPAAVEPAVRGRDAVISALGSRQRAPSTICQDGARAAIEAMRSAGVRRLVVVSAAGMHTNGDGVFTRTVVKPLLQYFLRHPFADMRVMEERVRSSDLDWTIVCPPRLTLGPATGNVRSNIGANVPGSFTISRADLAAFLLATVSGDAMNRVQVFVAHG